MMIKKCKQKQKLSVINNKDYYKIGMKIFSILMILFRNII
jgi:hypothetical protein